MAHVRHQQSSLARETASLHEQLSEANAKLRQAQAHVRGTMRTHAQLWAHVRGGNMRPVPDQDMPRFFVYSGKLDQAWLRQCPGFDALESGTATEKLGEVRLYDALQHHRLRTHNASEASLFYVPLWEYTSWALGQCRGTSHRQRMAAAFKQLAASPHWQRRPRDHIWGSTASTIDDVKLNGHLGRMTPLLRWVIVGRYKPFEGRTFDDGSNGGNCIIHMPFPAIASAATAGAHAWQPRRTLLFFAGAVDGVCCVGARVRCAVAELWGRTHGRPEYADVVIRPSLRSGSAPQPCLDKARRTHLSGQPSTLAAAEVVTPPSGGGATSTFTAANQTQAIAMSTGAAYGSSVFCLAPAGDMCVSSRVNSALAAGCIPVLLCDEWVGAFRDVVPYDDIVVRLDVRTFIRDPSSAIRTLRAMPSWEVERRQRALAAYRADTIWEAEGSRVADHILNEAASRCLPVTAAAEKVAACVARGAYKSVKDGSKHRGVCGETKTDDEGNCSATGPQPHKGSWERSNRTKVQTLRRTACKPAVAMPPAVSSPSRSILRTMSARGTTSAISGTYFKRTETT